MLALKSHALPQNAHNCLTECTPSCTGVAFLSAKRSKDPNKQVPYALPQEYLRCVRCDSGLRASFLVQVGACIVGRDNIILSIGYNGFPRRCHDSKLPWAKKSYKNDPLQTKYPFVCHAEMNAILNKNAASLHDSVCQRDSCKCRCCPQFQSAVSKCCLQRSTFLQKPKLHPAKDA